jgi:hypothetical protein
MYSLFFIFYIPLFAFLSMLGVASTPNVFCSSAADGCLWYNDLWRYDTEGGTWSQVIPLNEPPRRRSEHTAVVIGMDLYSKFFYFSMFIIIMLQL